MVFAQEVFVESTAESEVSHAGEEGAEEVEEKVAFCCCCCFGFLAAYPRILGWGYAVRLSSLYYAKMSDETRLECLECWFAFYG